MIGAEHSPGMETMTGSLGQGISQAAGIAMARKRKNEKGRVFIFMSDGEFQIGQTWEALQALSFHMLDNVMAIVNRNVPEGRAGVELVGDSTFDFGMMAPGTEGEHTHAPPVDDARRLRPTGTRGRPEGNAGRVRRTCRAASSEAGRVRDRVRVLTRRKDADSVEGGCAPGLG